MRVLQVNERLSVSTNVTSFTLYPNDIIFYKDDVICRIGYWLHEVPNIKYSDKMNFLDITKSFIKNSVCIGNGHTLIPVKKLIGGCLTDITTSYYRDELLNELGI